VFFCVCVLGGKAGCGVCKGTVGVVVLFFLCILFFCVYILGGESRLRGV